MLPTIGCSGARSNAVIGGVSPIDPLLSRASVWSFGRKRNCFHTFSRTAQARTTSLFTSQIERQNSSVVVSLLYRRAHFSAPRIVQDGSAAVPAPASAVLCLTRAIHLTSSIDTHQAHPKSAAVPFEHIVDGRPNSRRRLTDESAAVVVTFRDRGARTGDQPRLPGTSGLRPPHRAALLFPTLSHPHHPAPLALATTTRDS